MSDYRNEVKQMITDGLANGEYRQTNTLKVNMHVRNDDVCCTFLDGESKTPTSASCARIPAFMSSGYGEEITLIIDLETGQILNWNAPPAELKNTLFEDCCDLDWAHKP